MTGNKSKKTKVSSSPSFLDKASGFYARLEETEVNQFDGEQSDTTTHGMSVEAGVVEEKSCVPVKQEPGMFHFNRGMMEDDGTTTLLRRKPSRWSRRSSRKAKADKASSKTDKQTENTDSDKTPKCDTPSETQTYEPPVVLEPAEPTIIHFSISEEADDHGLLREQKSEIEVTEKKKGKETRGQNNSEQMKIAKRNTLKLYRKVRFTIKLNFNFNKGNLVLNTVVVFFSLQVTIIIKLYHPVLHFNIHQSITYEATLYILYFKNGEILQ